MKGIVFDIRRFCVHDGPGIRTTIFLKGCPLRCLWCHNPESQEKTIEMVGREVLMDGKKFYREQKIGKAMTADEVMQIIAKDQVFYNESSGGVTFSGGEPMSQHEFLLELLQRCKASGIHTAVDTCGYAGSEKFQQIIPFTDLFLFDFKHPDPKAHRNFTGVENSQILHNLEIIAKSGTKVILRIPVIGGMNGAGVVMGAMAEYLKELNGSIAEVNLLPYHQMAKEKYSRLKKDFNGSKFEKVPENELLLFKKIFENEGFKTKIGG